MTSLNNRGISTDIFTAVGGAIVGLIAVVALRSSVSTFIGALAIAGVMIIGVISTEWLFLIMVASAVFYTPLADFSHRVGGILVIPMDVLFVMMIVLILLKRLCDTRITVNRSCFLEHGLDLPQRVAGLFLLIFFVAIMLGFFRYHYWQTILTEAKVGVYFGAIPLLADLFRKRSVGLKIFLVFVVLASSLGSVYDLYARACHVYTVGTFTGGAAGEVSYAYTAAGDIVRDYGWGSTFVYQVFAVLISFAFFLTERGPARRLGWIGLFVINLVANLLTVTRGYMVGMFVGIVTIIFLTSFPGSLSEAVCRGKPIVRMIFACSVLLGLVFAVVQVVPQTSAAFERIYGLYDRHYAGDGDVGNMEFRIQSMRLGLRHALHYPLGNGFGYRRPSSSLSSRQEEIRKLVYHNSIGFMLYKFGLPGTLVIIGIYCMIIVRLLLLIVRERGYDNTISICLIASVIATLAMSITSTNWLFDYSSLLPFIVILISASLVISDSQINTHVTSCLLKFYDGKACKKASQ